MSTLAAAGNFYVPQATQTAVTGETQNVDNRFQTITVTSSTDLLAARRLRLLALRLCITSPNRALALPRPSVW
jgi:hypothetical protein